MSNNWTHLSIILHVRAHHTIEESVSNMNIYFTVNVIDFCNKTTVEEIKLKTGSNEVIYPVILQLSRTDSWKLYKSDCFVRFIILASEHWYSSGGLSVGIDNISLGNKVNNFCDNFIEISDNNKSESTKWCEDKNNDIGVSYKGNDYIDIQFHAGLESNSSFELIITPIECKHYHYPLYHFIAYYPAKSNAKLVVYYHIEI